MTKPANTCCNKKLPADNPDARTVCLTVGTAGHIDHGKTQLTIFLTGCNTDRLPEEKARGMTIDLGFATCILPDNRRIGIVDVPGHEKFVHNMVAGASGIDVLLLVIAADDGVMPQTIEHFHIVRLLGIKAGMIAITKTDLVDPSRVEDVKHQAEALVAGSFLEGAPIVPLSTKTGEGYDEFYTRFVELVDRMAERESSGPFRLHIERSFALKGLGTVVSGIPVSGSIHTGDTLELLPIGRKVRVKGLQVYGQKATEGLAGECVAVNLADISHTEIHRGMLLCTPGYFKPSKFYDVKFSALPSLGRPIRPRTQIRLHIGTSDVPGHLVLPKNAPLPAGAETYAQVQLREPAVAAPGDAFILRTLSPISTIGGGYIVASDDKRLRRRHRDQWTSTLEEKDRTIDNLAERIIQAFPASATEPLSIIEIARSTIAKEDDVSAELKAIIESGALQQTDKGKFASSAMIESAANVIMERLGALHAETPLTAGFSKKSIYSSMSSNHDVLDMALQSLISSKQVSKSNFGFCITAMAPALTDAQKSVAERILKLYLETRFLTPRRDEVPEKTGMPEKAVTRIMNYLIQTERLIDAGEGVIFHADILEESRQILLKYFKSNSSLDSGSFKGLIDSTRKYAIPLLEYWDRKGLTRRTGNSRVLKQGA